MVPASHVEPTAVEVRHTSAAVERRVRAWFGAHANAAAADGSRSIHLPHPEKRGYALKIKGAGYNAGAIRFGAFSRTGPVALTFDFDGRAMHDIASGHDNAYIGGASFQQAATEYNVSRLLAERGVPVVPCLGYGRVETANHASWFSVFDWHRGWSSASIQKSGSMAAYLDMNVRLSAEIIRLAIEYDLIGYCGFVETPEGQTLLKDLHPFRQADPITMSQLSWVMQVLFALNLRCQAIRYFPSAAKRHDAPEDIATYPLRAVLPDVKQADYDALRTQIVQPHMIPKPANVGPRELFGALRQTRVGAALLERCPQKYPRW